MDIREQAREYFESVAKPYLEEAGINEYQKSKYDIKYKHPYRVAELAEEIGVSLNLSKDDLDMLYVIALLHDVGRFHQIKKYGTMLDSKSLDHGDLSCDEVKGLNFISKFFSVEDCNVIYSAVKNHNNYAIDDNIKDERELMFCKLIRDADKLDIFGIVVKTELASYIEKIREEATQRVIAPEVLQFIENKKPIVRECRKTDMDMLLSKISLLFDVNYPKTFEIFNQSGYFEELTEFLYTLSNFQEIAHNYTDFMKQNQ
jgi:HD superfamily phosphohydrolase YqeK/uncharacterized protein YozE (UPF0346 family)